MVMIPIGIAGRHHSPDIPRTSTMTTLSLNLETQGFNPTGTQMPSWHIIFRIFHPFPPPTRTVDLSKVTRVVSGSHVCPEPVSSAASHATSSAVTLDDVDSRRASTGQNYRSSLFSDQLISSQSTPAISQTEVSSIAPSRYSRNLAESPSNSQHRTSSYSDRGMPGLPPIVSVHRNLSVSVHLTPPATPPALNSATSDLLSVPPKSPYVTPVPSPSPPLKHPPFMNSSSKISLVPSEGEDLDAFHVRNTYAQLEVSGVKGDGYLEGIERTRARVSRQSQLFAEQNVGDGSEKSRELDEKEIETLEALDRYVFLYCTKVFFQHISLAAMAFSLYHPMTA